MTDALLDLWHEEMGDNIKVPVEPSDNSFQKDWFVTARDKGILQDKKLQVAQRWLVSCPNFSSTDIDVRLCAQGPIDLGCLVKHLGLYEFFSLFFVRREAGRLVSDDSPVAGEQRS